MYSIVYPRTQLVLAFLAAFLCEHSNVRKHLHPSESDGCRLLPNVCWWADADRRRGAQFPLCGFAVHTREPWIVSSRTESRDHEPWIFTAGE